MFETDSTPMSRQRCSTDAMSRSGSLALRQAHTKASPFIAGRMSCSVESSTWALLSRIGHIMDMVPMPLARRRAPEKVFTQSTPAASSSLATRPLPADAIMIGSRRSTRPRSLPRISARVVRGTITAGSGGASAQGTRLHVGRATRPVRGPG